MVVTGVGVLSPFGVGVEAFWAGLLAGRSGISEIGSFDTSEYEVKRAGVLQGFDPLAFMDAETVRVAGRAAQFAIAAARMALDDARLDVAALEPSRAGVCLGTTVAEIAEIEAATEQAFREGPEAVAPALYARCAASTIPAHVAAEFGLGGPNMLIPTACAAGNYALGYARDLIRAGRADVMLAGGADPLSQIAFTGFHKLNSMAPDVPRPFSLGRKGMMVSEGAGVLVLEAYDAAVARGATIYAEVLGYGLACDAHHMTAPHPEGTGALAAMSQALGDAGLEAGQVDYINAHGTGTPANDKAETRAVKRLLGERAPRVPISSIKSMLGHTMGAASALEAIACVLAIRDGMIPPTANYEAADPDCDLDYVPNTARAAELSVVMSNSYAFGGNDASVLFGRVR